MKILYVGDIMGEPGVETVEQVLPALIKDRKLDLVVAQAENVSGGKGITTEDYSRLKKAGVDFFTGGNWSTHKEDIWPALDNPEEPIIRPANYPSTTPGKGYKYLAKGSKTILVVSLLGHIVGKDSTRPTDNPLLVIDKILKAKNKTDAVIVNFHGDFSSEKIIIGHYLDGRVTAVIGDHWHVPTADARVLPKGTAHMTDVGMCGALDSSLGVTFDSVIPRWRDNKQTQNVLEKGGPRQFNAALIDVNNKGLADAIEQLQIITNPAK